MPPHRRRSRSSSPHEVDRHGYSLELEALAELVLDPVAVIARHEAGIVDEKTEARRPCRHLRSVEQIEPAPAAGWGLARLAQLGQELVQLRGRDAGLVLLELDLDPVEQP